MRLIIPDYHSVKGYPGNGLPDEKKVSARILSFQLAEQLLCRYSGEWELTGDELKIHLNGVQFPLYLDLNEGTVAYGGLVIPFVGRYTPVKGLNRFTEELLHDLSLPIPEDQGFSDPILRLFVKLIEIFYARCGLTILPVQKEKQTVGWEIHLGKEGPRGFISIEGIAENRFGERVDIKGWYNLRPEKLATYVFDFNRFCA